MPDPENKSTTVSTSNCEATDHISESSLLFDPINLVGGYSDTCSGNGFGANLIKVCCLGGTVTITSSPFLVFPLHEMCLFVCTTSMVNGAYSSCTNGWLEFVKMT